MKHKLLLVLGITLFGFIFLIFLIRPYWIALKPALFSVQLDNLIESNSADPSDELSNIFTVHPDFSLEIITKELSNPRVIIEESAGQFLVTEPSLGQVTRVHLDGKVEPFLIELDRPHGITLTKEKLYIAETGRILAYDYIEGIATNKQVLLDLPSGGRHWTRSIGIGPDNALYITVGSTCNICIEEDWRITKMLRYDFETQALTEFASGLRNAVYFAWQPSSDRLFATEMGRDWLGDDLPPDELNMIEQGRDYGFPYCYGKNIVDPEYNLTTHCESATSSTFNFNAHEAPLGIDFYNNDIIVALHGSWNSTTPVGYEVIRLTNESDFQERESILSGFLRDSGDSIGRPAGILTTSTNEILVTDDKQGILYRLVPKND